MSWLSLIDLSKISHSSALVPFKIPNIFKPFLPNFAFVTNFKNPLDFYFD
jgi:hypothetical protein